LSQSWLGIMRKAVGCRLHKGGDSVRERDESTERGSVHDEKQMTENGAFGIGNTTGRGIQRRESVITSDMEGAR